MKQLDGRRILVVEDNYLIAEDVRRNLEEKGAVVLGPVPSVATALRILDNQPDVDAAVLDVNLGDETSFPIAETLRGRKVPFLFATGYNSSDIPPEWRCVPVAMKPLRFVDMVTLLDASGAA